MLLITLGANQTSLHTQTQTPDLVTRAVITSRTVLLSYFKRNTDTGYFTNMLTVAMTSV